MIKNIYWTFFFKTSDGNSNNTLKVFQLREINLLLAVQPTNIKPITMYYTNIQTDLSYVKKSHFTVQAFNKKRSNCFIR